MEEKNTPIEVRDDLYRKKITPIPEKEKNIGIDTKDTFFQNIIGAAEIGQLDYSKIEQFTQVSNQRDQVYSLIDQMCMDGTNAALIDTYAENATEYNAQGKVVWCESDNPLVIKYVNYLLDAMQVDKNAYAWVHSLAKYGDLYLRLYRESEYEDDLFFNKEKKPLNEDIKIKAFEKQDKYSHYIEMQKNPADMFDLTRMGKTYGYIKAKSMVTAPNNDAVMNTVIQYQFKQQDVELYEATSFVHACLDDSSSRIPEKLSLFRNDSTEDDAEHSDYTVKRGQSLLQNLFKIWRELQLSENSILLNRVTKSSVLRVLNVEVGDMPKEMVTPHLQRIKSLIEQKIAINSGKSLTEYTSPGPVENNIYVPTHGGIGALTTTTIGGDVDVKSLADLEYLRDKYFGTLGIPKQYFGFTEDGAGFNGGQSLSIVSSRFAKGVKRLQNAFLQALTDAINLFCIDAGLDAYVNQFTLKMQTPTTQEELDRTDSQSNRIGIVSELMNILSDISNERIKLQILKTMLASTITDPEVLSLIQEQIDELEEQDSMPSEEESSMEDIDMDMTDFSSEDEGETGSLESDALGTSNTETETKQEEQPSDQTILPTPEDIGVDMTDNT